MKKRDVRGSGPSAGEIRLRGELDSLRRELVRLKKADKADADNVAPLRGGASPPPSAPFGETSAQDESELERLRLQVSDLTRAKQRLSRLYFSQLEDNRRRQRRVGAFAGTLRSLAAGAGEGWLEAWAREINADLGCSVEVWVREGLATDLRLMASAGSEPSGGAPGSRPAHEFIDLFHDDFRIGHSYFVTAGGRGALLAAAPDAAKDAVPGCDWGEGDLLHVPIHDTLGPVVCVTLHRPKDGLVPSAEVVELLELHAHVIAAALGRVRFDGGAGNGGDAGASVPGAAGPAHLQLRFAATLVQSMKAPLHILRARIDRLPQEAKSALAPDARRLSRLVSVLSGLSVPHPASPEPAEIDLAREIDPIVALLAQVAAGSDVTFKAVVETADTVLVANREPIRHLALCLGGHAVQCAPHGGRVTLRVAGDEDHIVLEAAPSGAASTTFEDGLDQVRALVERCGGVLETDAGTLSARLPRRPQSRVRTGEDPVEGHGSAPMLAAFVEMVACVMGARVVSILGPSHGDELVLHAAIGLSESVLRNTRIRVGSGVAGWVARHRRPVCVSGAEERSDITGSGRALYRSRTFLSVPVEIDRRRLLVLNVTDPIADTQFGQDDCHLLMQLAEVIASACRDTTSEEAPRAVRGLLRRIEAGRRGGPGRVRLARDIAHLLGVGEDGISALSLAASVPDGVLDTPGADDLHTGLFDAARDIERARHEWWDGSGYPNAARCDEIPLGARIIAVTDAFLEATWGADDRRPVSREEALLELAAQAGVRFDPRVVEACATACAQAVQSNTTAGEVIAETPQSRGR